MKKTGRLEQFLANAPIRTRIALAAAGVMATLVAAAAAPAQAADIEPGRMQQITQSNETGLQSTIGQQDRTGVRQVDPGRLQSITQMHAGGSESTIGQGGRDGVQAERSDGKAVPAERLRQITQSEQTAQRSNDKERDLAVERLRPIPHKNVADLKTVNALNERTSDILRDANVIATRLYESKAWSGDLFTPEQKAKNIAQAFQLAMLRADHSEMSNLDGYLVTLDASLPEARLVENIVGDLNFKRETLRDAVLELGAMVEAVRDDRTDDVEAHRSAMAAVLADAGYALDEHTDWSVHEGARLAR